MIDGSNGDGTDIYRAISHVEDDDSDMWASTVAVARLIGGWACCATGVLNLSMGIDTSSGTTDRPYVLFQVVLLIGGGLLLTLGRLRKPPGPIGYAVAGAAAVLGLLLTALPATSIVCCMRNLGIRHGFPLTLLARDPGHRWHFAPAHAAADLLFWGLIGLLVLVGIALVRPHQRPHQQPDQRPDQRPALPPPADRAPTHAEDRSAAAAERPRAPHDENVGGLP